MREWLAEHWYTILIIVLAILERADYLAKGAAKEIAGVADEFRPRTRGQRARRFLGKLLHIIPLTGRGAGPGLLGLLRKLRKRG